MKNSVQLVNDINQTPLDIRFGTSDPTNKVWNYCDWDLDNGNFRMISGDESRVQSALKCIFTERRGNGYGSNIYNLIGEKDIIVRRLCLFLDLSIAMMTIKLFNDEQKDAQSLDDDDLFSTMAKLVVTEDSTNPTISKIQMSLKSGNTTTNIGVL